MSVCWRRCMYSLSLQMSRSDLPSGAQTLFMWAETDLACSKSLCRFNQRQQKHSSICFLPPTCWLPSQIGSVGAHVIDTVHGQRKDAEKGPVLPCCIWVCCVLSARGAWVLSANLTRRFSLVGQALTSNDWSQDPTSVSLDAEFGSWQTLFP